MFVRWKVRQVATGRRCGPHRRLSAYLVESEREDGAVRQRTIAYLASIREPDIALPAMRSWFHRLARERIAGLALPDEQQAAILAKLAERVPLRDVGCSAQ